MPASVVAIRGQRQGVYVTLEAALPGRPRRNIGVLLIDPETDRAFSRLRPSFDDIAARVAADSMEPRIPNGSLNLFRFNPAGSRQGKILLIERFGVLDETARYTVKRYTSRKVQTGEDEWRHEQIRLEPLNPAHSPWDVDPEGFAVVAEWLRVLE